MTEKNYHPVGTRPYLKHEVNRLERALKNRKARLNDTERKLAAAREQLRAAK